MQNYILHKFFVKFVIILLCHKCNSTDEFSESWKGVTPPTPPLTMHLVGRFAVPAMVKEALAEHPQTLLPRRCFKLLIVLLRHF